MFGGAKRAGQENIMTQGERFVANVAHKKNKHKTEASFSFSLSFLVSLEISPPTVAINSFFLVKTRRHKKKTTPHLCVKFRQPPK